MKIKRRFWVWILLCTALLSGSLAVCGASTLHGFTRTMKRADNKSGKISSVNYTGNWYTAYGITDDWKLRKLSLVQRRFGRAVMKAIREGRRDVVSIGSWNISYKEEDDVASAIGEMWYLFCGYPVFYRADSTYHKISGPEEFFVNVRASRRMLSESEKYFRMCRKHVKLSISAKANEKEKVNAILEALCRHMDYSIKISSLRSVIRKGKGVCADYSLIFRALCVSYGIQCRLISGRTQTMSGVWEDHVWNQVRVNGKWYYVDTTWMDAYLSPGMKLRSVPYYLSKTLWKDHRVD